MRLAVYHQLDLDNLDVGHSSGSLPGKWVICPQCQGHGFQPVPGRDYEIVCRTCKGRTSVAEPDQSLFTEEDAELYRALNERVAEEDLKKLAGGFI